ncbi:hypothetical protein D9M72_545920 [compost metagenome]
MGHGDDDAGAVEDQRERRIDEADGAQEIVDETLLLQQDEPGRGAHQKRRPQRQQYGAKHQITLPAVERGGDDCIRKADTGAGEGDERGDPEGAHQDHAVDGLIWRQMLNLTSRIAAKIDRGEQVAVGIGR